jgi:hypothetical protein
VDALVSDNERLSRPVLLLTVKAGDTVVDLDRCGGRMKATAAQGGGRHKKRSHDVFRTEKLESEKTDENFKTRKRSSIQIDV